MTYLRNRIVKNAQLWRVAVLKNDFESAIVINICERERAAIFREVQSCGSGNFREGAILIVHEHYVSCVSMPGVIRSDQFVDRIPTAFVRRSRSGIL